MDLMFYRRDAFDALREFAFNDVKAYRSSVADGFSHFFEEEEIKVPVFNTGIDVPDIDLLIGGPETDIENSRRIHEAFRGKLNRTQATDRRLWAHLLNEVYGEYMLNRWPLKEDGSEGTVTDRYFFNRGLMRNGISRLYWIAELSYDGNDPDPYRFTKLLLSKQDIVNQIEGRSIGRSKIITIASLKALEKAGNMSESQIRTYFEKLRKRGGVAVLDALSQEQAESLCSNIVSSVKSIKYMSEGTKAMLRRDDTGKTMVVNIKNRKLYLGNQILQNVRPQNIARLQEGKNVIIRNKSYTIIKIQ